MVHQLDCRNCGATLDIDELADIFSCGYCGSKQQVDRNGGIIQLRLISGAINGIKVSTDRTAAELAIVRLEKELPTAESEYNNYKLRKPAPPEGPRLSTAEYLVVLILSLGGSFVLIGGGIGKSYLFVLLGIMAFVAGIYYLYLREKALEKKKQLLIECYRRETLEPYEQKLGEYLAKLEAIKKRLEEQRGIVNQ